MLNDACSAHFALGFTLFWQSTSIISNILGLAIAGIGIANLYPLGLSVASNIGENNLNRVSARVALAGGSAILIIPQILGSMGDLIGLFNTFAAIFGFIVLLCLITIFVQRLD